MKRTREGIVARLEAGISEDIQAVAVARAKADEAVEKEMVEQVSTETLLKQTYADVGREIWRIHRKQWRRGNIGRLLCKLSGKVELPLGYHDGESYGELDVWVDDPDIYIRTPVLLGEEHRTPDLTAKVGWAFDIKTSLPGVMVGDAPMVAYLHPLGGQHHEISVYQAATDAQNSRTEYEKWYGIWPASSGDGFINYHDRLSGAELQHKMTTGEHMPAVVERNQEAQLHALSLAQQALPILRAGF